MVYQPKNPVGYRSLITWKQAGEIYHRAKDFTRVHLDKIKNRRLIDHINDSARSVQRNIEEGYKRSTTNEYIRFLGFSRASLEELKGDFEELKREWREGIRWEDKGVEKIRDGQADEIRGCGVEKIRDGQADEIRGCGVEKIRDGQVDEIRGCGVEKIRDGQAKDIRDKVIGEIEAMLDLIYGEDCMMGRQITALEKKMVEEKTAPRGDVIKKGWRKSASDDKRFWRLVETRFGIIRDEKGICRRVEKGSVDKGEEKGSVDKGGKGVVKMVENGNVEKGL